MNKKHGEVTKDIDIDCQDHVVMHTKLLVKLLLLRRNLHTAKKFGDGKKVLHTIKFMLPYFRSNNNYKYALACLELLAQTQFFLSPRQCLAIVQGRFVNFKGKPNTNYAIDLCVEHCNKVFKEHISLYRGECTKKVLDRISKAQTSTKAILDNYNSEFGTPPYIGQHKVHKDLYEEDVSALINFLTPYKLYNPANRVFRSSLGKAVADPVLQIDMNKLQDWLINKLHEMKTQTHLKRANSQM